MLAIDDNDGALRLQLVLPPGSRMELVSLDRDSLSENELSDLRGGSCTFNSTQRRTQTLADHRGCHDGNGMMSRLSGHAGAATRHTRSPLSH
jgi:hypothetical protein